jgi:hypothetical protein
MERQKATRLALALAALGAVAGVYELGAIATGEVPTITDLVLALPLIVRLVLVAAVVAATVDHFVTRRWL